MEHESNGDTYCNLRAQYSHQRIDIETGGLGNKSSYGDYSNYCIIKVSQNTEYRILKI